MTREMGSFGNLIAERIAADLGLRVLYHELIDSVSEKLHTPGSVVTRYVEGNLGLIERLRTELDALSLYTAEELLDVAAKGYVMMRGWGAAALLRPVSHVVCVRVCAPLALRAERLMARLGVDDRELALQEIHRSDAAHAAAINSIGRRFGADWCDALNYDLVINTERVTVDDAVDQIKALARRPCFQETRESRAQLLNLALAAHIQATLRNDHKTAGMRIAVDAHRNGEPGSVVLRGIVASEFELRRANELATQCAGVRAVDNQLKMMNGTRARKAGSAADA